MRPQIEDIELAGPATMTVFEPFIVEEFVGPVFVGCRYIGAFPPEGRLNPSTGSRPTELGGFFVRQRLSEASDVISFEPSDTREDINPGGVLAIYVHAEGPVVGESGAGRRGALFEGCACIRTDTRAGVGAAVSGQCAMLEPEDGDGAVEITLGPIASSIWGLEVCEANVVNGEPPPPLAACIDEPPKCGTPGGQGCYDCFNNDCPIGKNIRDVPVRFTVEGAPDRSGVVLTNREGEAFGNFAIEACAPGERVVARIVGTQTSTAFQCE